MAHTPDSTPFPLILFGGGGYTGFILGEGGREGAGVPEQYGGSNDSSSLFRGIVICVEQALAVLSDRCRVWQGDGTMISPWCL